MIRYLSIEVFPKYPIKNVKKMMLSGICDQCGKINMVIFDLDIGNEKYKAGVKFYCRNCKKEISLEIVGSLTNDGIDEPSVVAVNNVNILALYPVVVEDIST